MKIDQAYILLSVQRGLLDRISSFLRAVTVCFDETTLLLNFHFFYDCEITEKLFDLASCACAEADPQVSPYFINSDITTKLNYPTPIPIEGRLVYLRKEPTPTKYNQKKALLFADENTPLDAILLLAMLDALLGKVTPELRQVTITADQNVKKLEFYFFYDGEISKENFDLSNSAIDQGISTFVGYSINRYILRLDFPEKIPTKHGRVPYARYEG
jgi:hypothetical protein